MSSFIRETFCSFVGVFGDKFIFINRGKITCNGQPISLDEVRKTELMYTAAKVVDYCVKNSAPIKEGYEVFGLVEADGKLRLKEYKIDQYRLHIKIGPALWFVRKLLKLPDPEVEKKEDETPKNDLESSLVECFLCGRVTEKENSKGNDYISFCNECASYRFDDRTVYDVSLSGNRLPDCIQPSFSSDGFLSTVYGLAVPDLADYKNSIEIDCRNGTFYLKYAVKNKGSEYEKIRLCYDDVGCFKDGADFDYFRWYKYVPEKNYVTNNGMFDITSQLEFYFEKYIGENFGEAFGVRYDALYIRPEDDMCVRFCEQTPGGKYEFIDIAPLNEILKFSPKKKKKKLFKK